MQIQKIKIRVIFNLTQEEEIFNSNLLRKKIDKSKTFTNLFYSKYKN